MAFAALQSLVASFTRWRARSSERSAHEPVARPSAPRPESQARVALMSGARACASDDYCAAAAAFVSAVIAFRRARACDEATLAHKALNVAISRMPDAAAARAACVEAQAALERAGFRDDVARVLVTLGDLEVGGGDARRAVAAYRQAVFMHRAANNRDGEVEALCREATCHARSGRIEEANQLLADARRAADQDGRQDLLLRVNDLVSEAIDLAAPVVFADAAAADTSRPDIA